MNLDRFKLRLTAVFEPAPEGGYTCHFEELPEVFSEGETLEEAGENLLDALTQVMEYHRQEARKNLRAGAPASAGFGRSMFRGAQRGEGAGKAG